MRSIRVSTIVVSLLFAGATSAQETVSVSGTVTDITGVAVPRTVEVRAWSWAEDEELHTGERYTGYRVAEGHSTFVDQNGAWELLLSPGAYKLDARVGVTTLVPPCSTEPNEDDREPCVYPGYSMLNARYWLEERWHEAGTGFENHWVQEDASMLAVGAGSPIEEVTLRLRIGGAAKGRVLGFTEVSPNERVPLVGAKVRMEQVSDPRRHHNSVTLFEPGGGLPGREGAFTCRGLSPTLLHRLLVYDPEGHNQTYVHALTHTPTGGDLWDFGDMRVERVDLDPYPTNRGFDTAADIGRWHFDQDPPPVWSSGTQPPARIAPRNRGIANWFCWMVRVDDRFIVTATTLDTIPDLPGRYHPWMDPYLMVVDADAPDVPIEGTAPDRYSGPGPLDAMVDTLRIDRDGTYCAAVTSAGDYDFTGTGQYMAGPYVLTIERSPNPYTSTPRLGGPFEGQCSGGVITESPLVFSVRHDTSTEPFELQVQVYPQGEDPSSALIDLVEPADNESGVTTMAIDIGALPDNTRYTIRVRTFDGIHHSGWGTCDFWSNVRNTPPSELVILWPEPGTVLPLGTTEVEVEVQNAYDPDTVVPGTSLEIVWCSSLDPSFGDCPPQEEWNRLPQSSLDPADTTSFMVGGLTNREAWHIKACAMDETGLCGPADDTWVLVDDEDEGAQAPEGCCSASPGGRAGTAMLALFALALLAPRRRLEAAGD